VPAVKRIDNTTLIQIVQQRALADPAFRESLLEALGASKTASISGANQASSASLTPARTDLAFQTELLPQLEGLVQNGSSRLEAAEAVIEMLEEAFADKNAAYNVLVVYQSSFESDQLYEQNLTRKVLGWIRDGVE
jgi:hypothetical protein